MALVNYFSQTFVQFYTVYPIYSTVPAVLSLRHFAKIVL